MLVYRLCKVDEVNKLLDERNIESIGVPASVFINEQQTKNISSHEYNYHLSYLHFFKDLSSIFYFYTEEKFLCTYDIPEEILNNHAGKGFYQNYINYNRIEAVDEYAIPVSELSFQYLNKIDKITEFIDYDDYLYDPTLSEDLKPIYKKEGRSRTRKIS